MVTAATETILPVITIQTGAIFENDGGIWIKLVNPEIPRLAKVSAYPVWAADIGNGCIDKLNPYENVSYIGMLSDLISEPSIRRKYAKKN